MIRREAEADLESGLASFIVERDCHRVITCNDGASLTLALAVKCLLRDGLISASESYFDYGCGREEDLELLTTEGVFCTGWDPAHRPDAPVADADVVNLGYVLNVGGYLVGFRIADVGKGTMVEGFFQLAQCSGEWKIEEVFQSPTD